MQMPIKADAVRPRGYRHPTPAGLESACHYEAAGRPNYGFSTCLVRPYGQFSEPYERSPAPRKSSLLNDGGCSDITGTRWNGYLARRTGGDRVHASDQGERDYHFPAPLTPIGHALGDRWPCDRELSISGGPSASVSAWGVLLENCATDGRAPVVANYRVLRGRSPAERKTGAADHPSRLVTRRRSVP
jgi:hypothetical protein